MVLHERSRLAEHAIPHEIRRPERRPVVCGAGGHVHILKRSLGRHLAVGDRVHRTPAGEAYVSRLRSLGQSAQEMHDDLFGDDLQTARDILVSLGRLAARIAPPRAPSPAAD